MNSPDFFPYWILLAIGLVMATVAFSCKSPEKKLPAGHDISMITKGMTYIEVLEAAGIPDERINIGTVTDELGHETKTEEWHYGDNQVIVIVNDTVNAIDLDVQSTYRKIRHIIDSAKAAGDTASMIQSIH